MMRLEIRWPASGKIDRRVAASLLELHGVLEDLGELNLNALFEIIPMLDDWDEPFLLIRVTPPGEGSK